MYDILPVHLQRFLNPDRDDAEKRYALYRQAAYQDVISRVQFTKRYKLDGIGYDALRAFEKVWLSHKRRVPWRWKDEVMRWKRSDHSRLELAIWQEGTLCGLMLGKTSKRKTIVYVLGVEGAPYQHPLKGKIIPIAIEVAEAYATLLDAKQVRIVKPDPALIENYGKLGYTHRSGFFSSYMLKQLGD